MHGRADYAPGVPLTWSESEPEDPAAIWVHPVTGQAHEHVLPVVARDWTGPANASPSTETVDGVLARTNRAPVPQATSSWYVNPGSGGLATVGLSGGMRPTGLRFPRGGAGRRANASNPDREASLTISERHLEVSGKTFRSVEENI